MPSLVALLSLASLLAVVKSEDDLTGNPIKKVVKLIEQMKAQTQKDAEGDKENNQKYMCWCEKYGKEKEDAIKNANERISDLTTFIGEAAGTEGELKTSIETIETGLEQNRNALAEATELREKEGAEFKASEADMSETHDLLAEAIASLSKTQLIQKNKKDVAATRALLLQVREKVRVSHPDFESVVQHDLFDFMGSLPETPANNLRRADADGDAPKDAAVLAQSAQPKGATAGAKSYNSQGGEVFGMLGGMKDEMASNLALAKKSEKAAQAQFAKLKAAKGGEIQAAVDSIDEKKAILSDTMDKAAKAEEEKAAFEAALEADTGFLNNLRTNCRVESDAYTKRVHMRNEEIRALDETLKILTDDETRALFHKTMSFVQVGKSQKRAVVSERVAQRAMQLIAKVAKKHHNWALVSLAVRMRMDPMAKITAVLQKMEGRLNSTQHEEQVKRDTCVKNLAETEGKVEHAEQIKQDLEERSLNLKNRLESLAQEIEALKKEVKEIEVGIKQAGEDRKAENLVFQTSISDQRATIVILNKALDRLKAFYQPKKKAAFAQVQQHAQDQQAPPPPPPTGNYEKSEQSGGALQMITQIISESEQAEIQIKADEQHAQQDYQELVQDSAATLEAHRLSIQEMEVEKAKTDSEQSEVAESQLANEQELWPLRELLKAHHSDCDFLVKYFDIRQKARAEEIESMEEAEELFESGEEGQAAAVEEAG